MISKIDGSHLPNRSIEPSPYWEGGFSKSLRSHNKMTEECHANSIL